MVLQGAPQLSRNPQALRLAVAYAVVERLDRESPHTLAMLNDHKQVRQFSLVYLPLGTIIIVNMVFFRFEKCPYLLHLDHLYQN